VSRAVRRYQKWEREARESAYDDARGLALDLYHGRAGPLGPYEIGLALNTDEVLYRRVWVRYWTLGATTELMDVTAVYALSHRHGGTGDGAKPS
jgi:hypothetical protein